MSRDHPRIRGEHIPVGVSSVVFPGSPPHTRGARACDERQHGGPGITPAYAGSTHLRPVSAQSPRDHPRIRGEHAQPDLRRCLVEGSPPHTRGAPRPMIIWSTSNGITPAYAGSTAAPKDMAGLIRDHPRIRGEHVTSSSFDASIGGSPPHTRGALKAAHNRICHIGITPAYAGSTLQAGECVLPCRDHPRIRGEHRLILQTERVLQGSPPHTRGARIPWDLKNQLNGITPAYAGSTSRVHH